MSRMGACQAWLQVPLITQALPSCGLSSNGVRFKGSQAHAPEYKHINTFACVERGWPRALKLYAAFGTYASQVSRAGPRAGIESKMPYIDSIVDLDAKVTEENVKTRQHPDRDTAEWPPGPA